MGDEKEESSSKEASLASKRQKLDHGSSSSSSSSGSGGGKGARTVSPTKPDKVKAGSGLPKLDVAAAASRASDAAAGKSAEGGTPLFDTPTTPHPSREVAEKAKQEAEA